MLVASIYSQELQRYHSAQSREVEAKWGAIAAGILLLGALGVGTYFGIQSHFATSTLLHSHTFKIALISSSTFGLLSLSLLVTTIYQGHQKRKALNGVFSFLVDLKWAQSKLKLSDKELKALLRYIKANGKKISGSLTETLATGGLERLLNHLHEAEVPFPNLSQIKGAEDLTKTIQSNLKNLPSLKKAEKKEVWAALISIGIIFSAVILGFVVKGVPLPIPIGVGSLGVVGMIGVCILRQYLEHNEKKKEKLEEMLNALSPPKED